MPMERLQKLLARGGFGSRRACEEIVVAGRVTVDGRVVTELGAKADLAAQDVRVDGQRVRAERPEYWILNKPTGVVCTNLDPAGRPRAVDLMRDLTSARLFPVGRLDAESKGLLIMTNDGQFANSLTHPRYGVPKTYVATVAGDLTGEDMHRLVRSVWLAEGRTAPARVRRIKRGRAKSLVEVTLSEGRNRQARRMLAKLGHNVRELVRTRVGSVSLHGLKPGQARRLTPEEVAYLRTLPAAEAPKRRPRPPREGRRRAGAGPRGGEDAREPRQGRPGRPPRDFRRGPTERRPPSHWRPRESRQLEPRRGYDEDEGLPGKGEPPHPFMARLHEEAPPHKGFRRGGPPRGDSRKGGPPRKEFGKGGPPREGFREGGPPRKEFGKAGPRREGFREGGPPRKEFGKGAPPRKEFGKGGKRSFGKHDADGTGKAGEGDRRDAGRGRGGRPRGRGGPPRGGRWPGRHPPQ